MKQRNFYIVVILINAYLCYCMGGLLKEVNGIYFNLPMWAVNVFAVSTSLFETHMIVKVLRSIGY